MVHQVKGGGLVSSKSMDMWSVFDGDCKWRGFFGVKNNQRIVYS